METPRSSNVSSPREREPVMECHLVLTALSGTVVTISMSVAKFDRFEDLEDVRSISCKMTRKPI